MVVAFAPLAILLFQTFIRRTASPQSAALTYWAIVALIGASFGMLFLVYPVGNIVQTFLVTAIAFGGLSPGGLHHQARPHRHRQLPDHGPVGADLRLAGDASSSTRRRWSFAINLIGVADLRRPDRGYDTQRLKMTYYQLGGDAAAMSVATSYGALSLYLDFVNLFRFLLYFMGGSRR